MVSLEQVKLLETKVAKTIEYVERVTGENAVLQEKLDSYQQRIDELEVLVRRFKEDQGRIEDGILSALDRLNQFEDAIEKSLGARTSSKKGGPSPAGDEAPGEKNAPQAETNDTLIPETLGDEAVEADDSDGEDKLDMELNLAEPDDDSENDTGGAGIPVKDKELDIF
ncbi:MAG: cell division protein ZapB [Treponema sp.]|jgi:chromosome segregation ATPase|nr:cell division protein ZapB [Treponema sp.]